jgi:hypothetical protein
MKNIITKKHFVFHMTLDLIEIIDVFIYGSTLWVLKNVEIVSYLLLKNAKSIQLK